MEVKNGGEGQGVGSLQLENQLESNAGGGGKGRAGPFVVDTWGMGTVLLWRVCRSDH